MNIPELPIQFVAVTENMSQGVYTNSTDINSLLLAEGSNLADKLNAHFMTSMAAIPQKCKAQNMLLWIVILRAESEDSIFRQQKKGDP